MESERCILDKMTIRILTSPITLADIKQLAQETYGFMIKGSVDIATKRMAIGGNYHIESCEALTRSGSAHENIWGFNIIFTDTGYTLEYDSLINIKPAKPNRSRLVEDDAIRTNMQRIIASFIS